MQDSKDSRYKNKIAQGAQPISSYNYGAKNTERVKKTFRLLLTTCLIYSLTIWAVIMAFPSIFAGIFTPDAELIDFTSKALRIYCGVLGMDCLSDDLCVNR